MSGPMHIYHTLTFKPDSGLSWKKCTVMYFDNAFTNCSLLNLVLLSLERLHATIFPFRHPLMMNWIYLKAVVCIWLLALILGSAEAALFLTDSKANQIVWASLAIIVLTTVVISYEIITFNVKKKCPSTAIWCKGLRQETDSHVIRCYCSQHTRHSSLVFLQGHPTTNLL